MKSLIELPPPFGWFCQRLALWGALFALVRRDWTVQFIVPISLAMVISFTWLNAAVCGAVTNETGIVRGFLKGLGGFGLIFPVLAPFFLIAPAACLFVRIVCLSWQNKGDNTQLSMLELGVAISIFAVGAWQLSVFVKHRGF